MRNGMYQTARKILIAFALLALIGINMIREALGENDEAEASAAISVIGRIRHCWAISISVIFSESSLTSQISQNTSLRKQTASYHTRR